MASPVEHAMPEEVEDFLDRNWDLLVLAVGNRMARFGIPARTIGIEFWGVASGPLVRYRAPQLGGNIRVGFRGGPGINVDVSVFDDTSPRILDLPLWGAGSWKDRVDAVAAHEFEEVMAPDGVDYHGFALFVAPDTVLDVTSRARAILTEYRDARLF